jgi:hypothetical protein
MRRRGIVRGSLVGTLRHRRLWLVQLLANPLLALLFALWLLIPVANTWNIVLNVFVAILIVVGAIKLHGGTLNYFRDCDWDDGALLKPALWRALRHVLAIAVCIAAFYLLWLLMDRVDGYSDAVPAYLRSMMPVWLRQHITLSFLTSAYTWIAFTVRWLILPGLILPFAAAAADLGFRGFWRAGFVRWTRAVRCLPFWFLLAVAVLAGVLAAPAIIGWTPNFTASTLRLESVSLVIRVICAYELALWAWLLACYAVTRASIEPIDGDAH